MPSSIQTQGRKIRFFGWRIVGLGFLNNFLGVGIGTYAFAVLIKPITEDPSLNWTRTQVVSAFTVSIVVSTLTAPFFGAWLDTKHGARAFGVIIGIAGALGVSLTSAASELWQFYLFLGVIAAIFFQDPPFLLTPTTICKWFVRRRGMALSLGSMGISAGALVFLPLTRALDDVVGWRDTWLILGIVAAIVIVPLNALFMRGSPEDMGLWPDGADGPPRGSFGPASVPAKPEPTWTLKTAMKTYPFWVLLIANNLTLAGFIGTLVNHVAYLDDELSNSAIAGAAVMVFAVSSTLGKLPWAILADRLNPKYTALSMQLLCGIGMVLLIQVNVPLAFAYAVVFGMGIGGFDPLISLLWANYFGRTFLGTIRGFVVATNVVSFAGAPFFASLMFDVAGDYRPAFLVFAIGFFAAATLLFFAKRPEVPEPTLEMGVSS